ncbi:contact-dependent growth inhibition system immunity protein [Nocardiopsis sp. MG754419]|uniref:contact-dependent growth inhibition system immunity protein n=1 Tax=Nocardiopsis sp. MG754419 TaxID=2259865 RepID=UPI0027DC8755|nr:hypothetical protein [Nocardiopsis sp. MG754419]
MICKFFKTFMHQDWTISGETLEEVFESIEGFQEMRGGIRQGARALVESELTDQQLDEIIFGQWGSGYEPEVEDFGNWRSALEEIIRLCDKYDALEGR